MGNEITPSTRLKVEYRKVADLIPYARNARTHSDEQVSRIAGSIQEFGWTNPILVDGTNGILAGHGRLAAARKLGMSEVPVIELAGLSKTQKRAYILADNKLALDAGWDDELLKVELEELKLEGVELDDIGFSSEELDSFEAFSSRCGLDKSELLLVFSLGLGFWFLVFGLEEDVWTVLTGSVFVSGAIPVISKKLTKYSQT